MGQGRLSFVFDLCPVLIDIVDRNATGRWQGLPGLG